MDNLTSGTNKQFKNLLDTVAADDVLTGSEAARSDDSGRGPSVGDDGNPLAPTGPSVTILGPSVGDDGNPLAPTGPSVTMLGPSVGDDGQESDLRLKEDVQRVGTTVLGLPLYHFKYIGAPETYEGVMAQDVLQVKPGAVSVGTDGYYRVNYSALGTSMRQVS